MIIGGGSSSNPAAFVTPAPLKGYVLFISIKTGDAQLDRLLGQGWKVFHDDGAIVALEKGDGEKRKTMTHHRPKKKK
jgi:hypothetical protein